MQLHKEGMHGARRRGGVRKQCDVLGTCDFLLPFFKFLVPGRALSLSNSLYSYTSRMDISPRTGQSQHP